MILFSLRKKSEMGFCALHLVAAPGSQACWTLLHSHASRWSAPGKAGPWDECHLQRPLQMMSYSEKTQAPGRPPVLDTRAWAARMPGPTCRKRSSKMTSWQGEQGTSSQKTLGQRRESACPASILQCAPAALNVRIWRHGRDLEAQAGSPSNAGALERKDMSRPHTPTPHHHSRSSLRMTCHRMKCHARKTHYRPTEVPVNQSSLRVTHCLQPEKHRTDQA